MLAKLGLPVALAAVGIGAVVLVSLEARTTGDPGLLVASGLGWLCFAGPTAGVLRRWWRFRR